MVHQVLLYEMSGGKITKGDEVEVVYDAKGWLAKVRSIVKFGSGLVMFLVKITYVHHRLVLRLV